MLGAIAATTDHIGLVTGVTCPSFRYHPAIVAQAAATTQILSDGRFTLGVGAGERLNEHVTGEPFPSVRVRHEVFREALEIISLLWQGGYQSYERQAPPARGRPHLRPARAAADHRGRRERQGVGDHRGRAGRRAVRHRAQGVDRRELPTPPAVPGRSTPRSRWPGRPTSDSAAKAVLETTRWALTGWKVMSELPNPVNFDAATTTVRPEDITEQFAVRPRRRRHLEVAQQFVDAGFDHLVLMNAGPDPDGFFDFFARELAEPLRALSAS